MKNSYLTAVLTLTCVLGMGISAHTQETEGVRVNVPFEFVAGRTTLPAGAYTVGRLSDDASSGIVIRSLGHGAIVLPVAIDSTSSGQPKLSFDHIGDRYFLSGAETPGGTYTFALPRAVAPVAEMKGHGTVSSGGAN